MKTSIERAWVAASNRAGVSPAKDGGFIIFLVDEKAGRNIYGGVDSEGNLLLAIEMGNIPPVIEIRSSALDYLRQERKGGEAWLMVFRLRRIELASVFGRLCQDLIDEIQGLVGDAALLSEVRKRIALWQRLFEISGRGLLADFQIKGLLAELLFLESQLSAGREPLEAATGWVGPSGGDQDFLFSERSFEIKAIAPNAEGVTISTLQQLDSKVPLRLSVWTMRPASPSEPRAETLNELVARIEEAFAPVPAALQLFRDAMLEAGYVVHPYYSEIAFEPMHTEEFPVLEAFPRLTQSSVPSGVTAATYVVSLHKIRSAG